MKQPPIDLLPAPIRARAMAGVVIGRYVVAMILAVICVVVPSLLARIERALAADELRQIDECKILVEMRDRSIREKEAQVVQKSADLDSYDKLALPLPMSRIIATLVNAMPGQLTLEKVDLRVKLEAPGPSGGERAEKKEAPPPRLWLAGELRGFGPDDLGAADYAARLKTLGLCRVVKLEHVRDRSELVRNQPAREFLISLSIDLNRRYDLRDPAESRAPAAAMEPQSDVE